MHEHHISVTALHREHLKHQQTEPNVTAFPHKMEAPIASIHPQLVHAPSVHAAPKRLVNHIEAPKQALGPVCTTTARPAEQQWW